MSIGKIGSAVQGMEGRGQQVEQKKGGKGDIGRWRRRQSRGGRRSLV
jgi:hypothetical protein